MDCIDDLSSVCQLDSVSNTITAGNKTLQIMLIAYNMCYKAAFCCIDFHRRTYIPATRPTSVDEPTSSTL